MWCRAFSRRPSYAAHLARGGSMSTQVKKAEDTGNVERGGLPGVGRAFGGREFLFPLSCTSQDKQLVSLINEAVDTQRLVIAYNYRGARKTTTSQRVEFQSKYPFLFAWSCWPLLRYRVVHVTWLVSIPEHLDEWHTNYRRSKLRTVVLLFIAMNGCWLLEDGEQKEKTTLVEQVEAAFQQHTAAKVFVLVVVALFLFKRRLVVVVDDVLSFHLCKCYTAVELRRIIDRLKELGLSYPIVVLSSNEGYPMLFTDNIPSTYLTRNFARATPEELVRALSRHDACRPISVAAFQRICESFGMEHHVYSMQWYPLIPNGEFARLTSADVGALTPVLSRKTLRTVAFLLDQQCQDDAVVYCLAYSQVVDVRASLKGYFTEDEITAVVNEYGVTGPRLLVLTAALLIVGRSGAQRALVAEATSELAKPCTAVPKDPERTAKREKELRAILEAMDCGPQQPVCREDVEELTFYRAVRHRLQKEGRRTECQIFDPDRCCNVEVGRITRLLNRVPCIPRD